jgi:hypothetical protein
MLVHKNDVIEIQQTLHGYSDGHRLLEASRALPRKTERTVLIVSDMSGPTMLRGFESYLTGYPLPDASLYALARTWYAAEMTRPGCVWTHTLFIENADLARISDLRALLGLFSRPQSGQALSEYHSPLTLRGIAMNAEGTNPDGILESIAANTLVALYSSPDKPVYIPADSSERYEDLILAIWTQQWPRLRRSFRFCTGSLSNRTVDGEAFDMQVVPVSLVRHISREVPHGGVIDTEKVAPSTACITWLNAATTDLLSERDGPLRRFLWEFGADLMEGRAVFSRLVEVFTCLENMWRRKLSLTDLTEVVSQRFPTPTEAVHLKAGIFGEVKGNERQLLRGVSESELLRELVTTKHHAAFDAEAIGMRGRARVLWESEKQQAKNLIIELVSTDLNPLGEELLAGFAEAMEGGEAADLLKTNSAALLILVKHNPVLATSPRLWYGSLDEQQKLLAVIMACQSIAPVTLKSIIAAMLASGADTIATDVLGQFGRQAVAAVLEWFNSAASISPQELKPTWRLALASYPHDLLDWLHQVEEPHVATFALVASLLDPNSREVWSFGTEVWLRSAASVLSKLSRNDSVRTGAFLLALAFNNPQPRAEELVSIAFERVHDAVEKDEITYDSWRLLEGHLPILSWWSSWDKCERLRRALVDKFIYYSWPIEQFLQSIKGEETFLRVVRFCKGTAGGRAFLEKVVMLIKLGEVHATYAQRAVLAKAS